MPQAQNTNSRYIEIWVYKYTLYNTDTLVLYEQTNVFSHHIHNPRNSSTLRQGSLKTKCNRGKVHLSVCSCLLWHLNGEDTEQMYSKHHNVSIIRQTVNFINTPQYLHTGYIGCLHEMEIQIFKKYGLGEKKVRHYKVFYIYFATVSFSFFRHGIT